MSFNRKQQDKKKVNNFVAKNDFNKGGFHGKSTKQKRSNTKSELGKIDIDNVDQWEYFVDDILEN